MTVEETADAIVKLLEPLRPIGPVEEGHAYERDELIREAVRLALKKLDVYDAHGCPLCLS